MNVRPRYGAIEAVRDICEPWIEALSGDEWGESMVSLHGAAQTSYGLSDEDCAAVAEILLRNLPLGYEDAKVFGLLSPEQEEYARKEATESRDYWLKGGNLGNWDTTIEDAESVIQQMPKWMFNDN